MGQVISLIFAYFFAFEISAAMREHGNLVDIETNRRFTLVHLVMILLISTFESVTALAGLYGIWHWKKWGVYIVVFMGVYYIIFALIDGASPNELRLGLGLMDYTSSYFFTLGPYRIDLPPGILGYILLVYGVYRAIKRRWEWFQ
ncbi:hypothetical protein ABF87_04320 [Nitrosomonas sp. JL21]|uniref:hypothetical protein n=1 Tax=Nitrosomonas sp. JL21 TaxID=153949 RepID=UPI00136D9827|nr:hypothetical protein [Nitrosomonas sp. JL21]MBL8497329.1 hypothetical protein [Nitrosomonas sp.]MXS77198.1 hypothetical protein [Nitrosomonas sp. JL21]